MIRLADGRVRLGEIHWNEGHGIGKKEFKRKRWLDEGGGPLAAARKDARTTRKLGPVRLP
ncbi:MAG: hypothetical protein P8182_14470 [Deltaproteobacteria bacterium]